MRKIDCGTRTHVIENYNIKGIQKMATKQEVQGTWNQLAGAVKSKYAQVTGDDLAGVNGNIQQLAGVIQKKTGKAREEVKEFLRSVSDSSATMVGRVSEAASDMAAKTSETFRDGYDYARDASRDGIKAAAETVQHRPGQSMLVAVGIGVIAGLVIGKSLIGKSLCSNCNR